MKPDNQFQYVKSQQLSDVTVLHAQMNDFYYDKHAHEEFSFGVTLTGRQDFFANGEFYRSRPGNVIVFNPEEVHDGHSGEEVTLNYSMLYVHPNQLEPMLAQAGAKNSDGFRIRETLLQDAKLRQHIVNLSAMIGAQSANHMQQECELYLMAERIAQCHAIHSIAPKATRVDTLLKQAKVFIYENLHQDLSLEMISQQANLSKYHFLRLFREQFGITPHQFILNCRVNRVREALERGTKIEDIVYDYGFSDLSHLNRRFKPIFGMTPRQYQQHFLSS